MSHMCERDQAILKECPSSPAAAPVGVSSSSSILAIEIEAVGPGTGGDIGLAADGGAGESKEPDGFKPNPVEEEVSGAAELGRGGDREVS